MTSSLASWKRLNETKPNKFKVIGQRIRCARCDYLAHAASPNGPVMEHWRVIRWPDECYCPNCKHTAPPAPVVPPVEVGVVEKKRHIHKSVPYAGVVHRFDCVTKPYIAVLYDGAKRIRVGSFSDPIVAARARDKACWERDHDLSKLNFPEDYQS